MGHHLFYILAFLFAFRAFGLEVVINPYEGLENLEEGEILAFHYGEKCNPCIEVIEPEPYEYDDYENSSGCETKIEYIHVPYSTPSPWY